MKRLATALFALIALSVTSLVAPAAQAQIQQVTPEIRVVTPVKQDVSPALRDINPADLPQIKRDEYEVPNKTLPERFIQNRALGTDGALQQEEGRLPSAAPLQNFEGLGNPDNADVIGSRIAPPDPMHDVGEDYVVEMINLIYAVYNKDGTLAMDPLPNNAVWSGFGGACENLNDGDPVVLYDQEAERWILSQFADALSPDAMECVAVSTSSDPTGTYYRYAFPTPGNDYPKLGVGADAYYYSQNTFNPNFQGATVGAFDRDAMINGDTDPEFILFGPNSGQSSLLPADIDGPLPTTGTPGVFAELVQDAMRLYEFDPDFEDPANSTFNEIATLDVEPFDSDLCSAARDACIEQPNGQSLESLADRLMHRLQFRDMGSYNAMVVSHTVDVDGNGRGGVRWYEFRDDGTGWSVYQQGTYAPGETLERWMPSIAMNASGFIALGYSASSSEETPSIRYTARPPGAPLGEMTVEETIVIESPSSQSGTARWGDYTSMNVDPTNGAFWYVNEYANDVNPTFNWNTRIAAFQFDSGDDTPPTAISDLTASPVASNAELTWTAPADNAGDPGSGPVSFYEVRYTTDGPIEDSTDFANATPASGPPSPAEPGTEQNFVVQDLDFGTQYYFAVRAIDDNFNTSLSNSPSATTGSAPVLAYSPDSLVATLETNETTTLDLTLQNTGPGDSELDFTFPAFAASSLLERTPDYEENDVSRPIGDASHAKGEDPFSGAGNPVILGAGGEDDFGYSWIDSNEPGGPTFDWTDISDLGTEVTSITDDFAGNPSVEVTLPFIFEFYGEEKSQVRIDNNGFLFFDSPSDNYYANDPIPESASPNGLIAPFWDDLNPDAGGAVYTYHDNDNDRFIVQYDEIPSYSSGELYTYQIILREDGSIRFQYLDMDETNINSATTGIENAAGDDGLQIAFNTEYVEDNLAVEIAVTPDFIADVEPASGVISGGSSQEVDVTFTSADTESGIYEKALALVTNDPDQQAVSIPAKLTVQSGAPDIAVNPSSLDFGEVLVGDEVVQSFTIANNGAGPLEISSITTDNPNFEPGSTGDLVIPFSESVEVPVTFLPPEVGTETGTITIESDDPDESSVTVALSGVGVPPPDIAVDPDSLNEALEVGETSSQTLTVTNTGESTLEFEAIFELGVPSGLTRSDVAATSPAGRSVGGDAAESASAPSRGISSPSGPLDPMDATYQLDDGTSENALGFGGLGDDFDAMWLNAFEVVEGSGAITSISTTWGSDGSTSAPPAGMTGLALVYEDPNDDGDPSDAVLLAETEITVQDPATNNFTTASISPTTVEGTFFIAVLLQNNDADTFPMPMDESSTYQEASWAIATTTPGTFDKNDLSSNETFTTMGDIDFPANWLLRADGGASFVTVSPDSGSVEPGNSQDLTVNFDATGLEPDLYSGAINLNTNVPSTPVLEVPTTLEVLFGEPDIAVDPQSLGFGEVLVGATRTENVTIFNNGNAPLEVTDISSDNAAFSASTDSLTIPLGDSASVDVTFSPDAVQSYSGTLTIESDDSDESSVNVGLSGEGVPAPVIATNPDSLYEELEIGHTATDILTVTNTGGSDLDFSVGFDENNGEAPDRSEVAAATNTRSIRSAGSDYASAASPGDVPSTPIPLDAEDADYQVDDGSSENALGLTGGGDIMWMNAFEAIDGSASIAALYSAYGASTGSGLPNNADVTAYVYEDPNDDGDPSDAELLTEVDFELQDPHTDTFTEVDMGGVSVDGVFFVAVLFQNHADGQFPAPIDENSGSMQSSWVVGSDAGTFDAENLTSNALPPDLLDDVGFAGNWLLRADGGEGGGGGGFPEWVDVQPFEGTVAPGESQDLEVTYDASGLEVGIYSGDIEISSNDPETPVAEVPTTLDVTTAPYPFALSPDSISVTIDKSQGDTTETAPFTIANTTDEEQYFLIEARGGAGNAPIFQNFISDELRKEYEQRLKTMTRFSGKKAQPSMEAAPESPRGGAMEPFARIMAPTGVTAWSTSIFGDFSDQFVSLDLGEPQNLSSFGSSPTTYAGDYVAGDDETYYVVDTDSKALLAVDKETGETTEVGTATPGSYDSWSELAGDPTDGTLYGSAGSDAASSIFTIDSQTGETEEVGEITLDGASVPFVIAIAIDGDGQMWGYEISNDTFLKIDKETGEATTVGPIGFDANYAQGMDYDLDSGTMYMAACRYTFLSCVGELRTVDLETGSTSLVGTLGPNGDELGYLALPSGGFLFLDTDLISGTLTPGGDVTLDANLSAEGLIAGTYNAQLAVISDEPGQPEEVIPVTLEVLDAPQATLDPMALDFGEVFVGGDTTQTIALTNTGGDDLEVSDIQLDPDFFSISDSVETSFTLEPTEARMFTVHFSPDAVQEYNGTFTVVSNNPDGDVSATLTGEGISAPVANWHPHSFDLRAAAGQSLERTLEISNAGGNTLTYEITPELVSSPGNEPEPQVVFEDILLEEDFDDGIPANWSVVDEHEGGVTWILNDEAPSPDDNYTGGDGKAAHADSDDNQSTAYDTKLVSPILTASSSDLSLEYKANFAQISDTLDVDITTDGGSTWTNLLRWTDDHGTFRDTPGEMVSLPLGDYVEEGATFQIRWRYYDNDSGAWNWYAQIDDVKILRQLEFLTVNPNSGAVAPSETDSVSLNFDTMGLEEGTYEVDLNISTNDPAEDSVTVPISLEVIEDLVVTPEPGPDSTRTVAPGEEFLVPITVESLDNLGVESYEFTLTFSGALLDAVGVETAGTLSEGLSLAVNTNEDGQVSVAAADNDSTSSSDDPLLFSLDGEGTLIFIRFQPKDELGSTQLAFTNFLFNEGEPPVTTETTSIEVDASYGDVTFDGTVSALDASRVLDYTVGLVELSESAIEVGDVSGNGDLTAFDASLILDYVTGVIDCFPVEDGCSAAAPGVAAKRQGGDASQSSTEKVSGALAWGDATNGQVPDVSHVPLLLEESSGPVRAVQLTSSVDADKVSIQEVESNLPDDWQIAHNVTEDGTLKLSLAGSTPIGDSKLATLQLQWLKPNARISLAGKAQVNESAESELTNAEVSVIPDEFSLENNYPNPFARTTKIELNLPQEAKVNVEVYNVLGRRVMQIEEDLDAGSGHTVQVDGSRLAPGMYIYRVVASMKDATETDTGRMTLVK